MSLYVYACMSLYLLHTVHTQVYTGARRGHWISWDWSYKELWAALLEFWEPSLDLWKSSKPLTSEYSLQHSFKMWVFDMDTNVAYVYVCVLVCIHIHVFGGQRGAFDVLSHFPPQSFEAKSFVKPEAGDFPLDWWPVSPKYLSVFNPPGVSLTNMHGTTIGFNMGVGIQILDSVFVKKAN